jgi:hypothetical protein
LTAERRSLGTEMRTIRTLMRDEKLRNQVDALIRRREDEIAAANKLAGYFAVLDFYQQIYPPRRLKTHAKEDREQATTENLVLRRELKLVAAKVPEDGKQAFQKEALDEKSRYDGLRKQLGDQKFMTFQHQWAKAAHVEA